MPTIVPIKDLKDTARFSELVHLSPEPVFVTKNGYGDMVVMSIDVYERSLSAQALLEKLDEGEADIKQGKVRDAFAALDDIRARYEL